MGPLVLTCLLLSAAPANDTVTRCPLGAEQEAARGLLRRMDAALKAGDAPAVKKTWKAIEAHRCFELPLQESWRRPPVGDVEVLAQWWESGGEVWLGSGFAGPEGPFAVVPPDAPTRVDPKKAGGLARLTCARGAPASCGRESAGWVLRAKDRFAPRSDNPIDTKESVAAEACAEMVTSGEPRLRYQVWRDCLEGKRPKRPVLPFGRFDAPRDGWLVLRGRRGHYEFCDEVRAYDLATGAAWVAKSCSGLVLRGGGSVDHDATDAQRGLQVHVGRLPLEALREAAWMTLLARHVEQHAQPWAWSVRLPPGLEPQLPRDEGVGGGVEGGGFWGSSAQTRLAWSWQGGDGLRDSGKLTWPDSASPGEDYADELWRVAEASFEEGCAPARPPKPLVVGGSPGVSRIDAAPASLQGAERKLLDALFAHGDGCADAGR